MVWGGEAAVIVQRYLKTLIPAAYPMYPADQRILHLLPRLKGRYRNMGPVTPLHYQPIIAEELLLLLHQFFEKLAVGINDQQVFHSPPGFAFTPGDGLPRRQKG
jgi:hypothetical protein